MSEVRKTAAQKLVKELGCVLWPIGIGLFCVWLAGRFDGLYCFHVAAIVAFGVAVLGFRMAIVDRLRVCPHGVRGAIASPPLCTACLAEKKAREHADKLTRKRRRREKSGVPGG